MKHKLLISLSIVLCNPSYAQWNNTPKAIQVVPIAAAPSAFIDDANNAPVLPSIESIQEQQQNRINWGVSIGRISGQELRHIQRQQARIEQQRYYAYADAWLTPEEQQAIFLALNALSDRIELSLYNVDPVYYPQVTYYVPPPVLQLWIMPWWTIRPAYSGPHIHYAPAVQSYININVNIRPTSPAPVHPNFHPSHNIKPTPGIKPTPHTNNNVYQRPNPTPQIKPQPQPNVDQRPAHAQPAFNAHKPLPHPVNPIKPVQRPDIKRPEKDNNKN